MLSQLRKNTKIILWVVIVAFVGLMFFVWGMNLRRSGGLEAGVVGKIDDARITVEQYRNEVANQRAAYYQDKGARRGAQAETEINDRAWDTIVQNHLLIREVQRERLLATEDEVMLEMQANPPAFIRAQPIFLTDSVFDHSKYLAALSDPQYDFRPLEAYIRATLPLQKLQEYVAAGVRVTDDEARLMISMLEEKAVVTYVKVSPITDVRPPDVQPSDGDLDSYYSSHTDEFKLPETRKFKYVQFSKQPSAEDEQYARDRVEEARDAITAEIETNGSDLATVERAFSEIATEYTDDEMTARTGGDLGWIKRGQMRGVLDSVAFRLDVGKVSDVLRTDGGYHLLLVAEKRLTDGADEVRVRHIMARLETSASTIEQLKMEAGDFAQIATGKGVAKACEEKGLAALDSPGLTEQQMASFYRLPAEAAETVFKMGRNQSSGVLEGAQAFMVLEVTDIEPEHTPQFDEIKDRVRQAYLMSLRKDRARQIAAAVADGVAQGRTLEAAAAAAGLVATRTEPFAVTSTVPGLGKESQAIASAFALIPGQTSRVIESGGEFFIIRLESLTPPNLAALGGNFGQVKASLAASKQQAFLNDWYSGLLGRAEITDNRSSEASSRRQPTSSYLYTGY